jgi:hypothetical protein
LYIIKQQSTMSDPIEPGVKKATRRFAPVKRGASKSAAGIKREEAAQAAAAQAATQAATNEPAEGLTSATATPEPHVKTQPIGTMRPEGVNSGRLQSVNDGQKTRGGTAKVS